MAKSILRKALDAFKLVDENTVDEKRNGHQTPVDDLAILPTTVSNDEVEDELREVATLFNVATEAVSFHEETDAQDGKPMFRVVLVDPAFSLSIAVQADYLTAYLVEFSGSSNNSIDDIVHLLKLHGLAECDREALERAISTLDSVPCQAIAHGQAPIPGSDDQVHFPIYPDSRAQAQAQSCFPSLASSSFEELPQNSTAIWVQKGELLAEFQSGDPGAPGIDIFGRTVPTIPGAASPLKPGANVDLSEDGSQFTATSCGYFFMREGAISIRPPLHIYAEQTEVVFAYIPPLGPSVPTEEHILQLLQDNNIVQGLALNSCDEILTSFAARSEQTSLILIAQGQLPQHGRDGQIQLNVDCERKPGKILPDGSIDFREIQFGIDINDGTILARVYPATEGQAGFTVTGADLAATDGKNVSLNAGANVEVDGDLDALIYHATIDGRVRLENGTLHVYETLSFSGDIDFQSGNVDFSGDVFVSGSVLSNFTVKAQGNIFVQGMVEAGAQLHSEGDIIVSGGIVGDKTRAVAHGALTAKFIADATVRSGADLVIGSYIFGANVRSEGQVIVHQGGSRRSGTISGGKVLAAKGIKASFAGSPNGTSTELVVGVDPGIEESLRRCQQQLVACQENLKRLNNLLGLDEITVPRLKHLLQSAAPQKRPQLSQHIRQWQRLSKVAKAVRDQIKGLRENLAQPALQAILAVDKTIYPGVKLRLGERTAHVHLELNDTTLTPETWSEKLVLEPAA